MPVTVKPLFRPEALSAGLDGFALPPTAEVGRGKLRQWAGLLGTAAGLKLKETQVRDEFLYDVFRDLLGYTTAAQNPADFRLTKEQFVQVDGTYADAGFGRLGGADERFALVLEGKGPRDPLDRPFAGRKRSAYEQALLYAVNLKLDWFLVTSVTETRLHYKGADQITYERFPLKELADDDATFARFVFLLGADRVVPPGGGPNHLTELLTRSRKVGKQVTDDYYAEYGALRERTFAALCQSNPGEPPAKLLAATQKLLDRVLFVCFCEDRGLMPDGIVARAYSAGNAFTGGAVYDNFKGLFRSVDKGSDALNVARYNGGLFAPDPYLDALTVPNAVCDGFRKLADYEYGGGKGSGRLIDVDILGHVFEQSIGDLEEMQQKAAGGPAAKPKKQKADEQSGRRKSGAFYTPAYITRYIVGQTVGPALRTRFERLRADHQAAAGKLKTQKKAAVAALADPTAPVSADASVEATAAVIKVLAGFWAAWLDELPRVKVVDPACGSGAFLIEAFDQLFAEYERAEGFLQALGRPSGLFRPRKTILANNLFGVDKNGEAVEIARLSCWIKTAELGVELTSLDATIRQANSLFDPADPAAAPLAHWRRLFPAVMAAGGFDAVVGNPPYVRAELIRPDKPHLERHYAATYHGSADLYVYFYELALTLLSPAGRLGFIVTNKWLKADYGAALRTHFGTHARIDRLIDFGHAKAIFPDADVFPCILIAGKPSNVLTPPPHVRVCDLVGRPLAFADVDLDHEIESRSHDLPPGRLSPTRWLVGSAAELDLFERLERAGRPLKAVIGGEPLYGIKTGYNPAYLLDTPTKEALVAADPASAGLFKAYLRGEDLDRWHAAGAGLWMLAMKSSGNHPWPWASLPDDEAEAVFRKTYPAVFAHCDAHREKLSSREDQGRYWWELRACAYWDAFDQPKVMYQEIQFHPSYLLDTTGMLANNKVFMLPTADPWVLAVLNSPFMWWFNWRYLPHMKSEALSPVGFLMEKLPIPDPTPAARARTEAIVARLIDLTAGRTSGLRALLDWLRVELGVERVSNKLSELVGLAADELAAEVRQCRPRKAGLSSAELQRLRAEYTAGVVPLREQAAECRTLEQELADLVNAAYGLTPADVALMWRTAPPRMPTAAPKPQ